MAEVADGEESAAVRSSRVEHYMKRSSGSRGSFSVNSAIGV